MKFFKLVLLAPTLISGVFAIDIGLDQLMKNAVLSFRDILTEQNKKIAELVNRVSTIEQQLQIISQKVSNLESNEKHDNTAVIPQNSKILQSRFKIYRTPKPEIPGNIPQVKPSSSDSNVTGNMQDLKIFSRTSKNKEQY